MSDGDEYSFENFGLGGPCFYATNHFKTEAKTFF